MATDSNGVVIGPTPPGVPHLMVPFTIGADGSAMVVEQDSDAEIVQSVAMLVGTTPGTRTVVPRYGTTDPTFRGLDQAALARAVAQWEPRAAVSVVVTPGGTEQIVVAVKNRVGQ